MNHLVVVGAGGFGREVLQYFRDAYGGSSTLCVRGFLDDGEPSGIRSQDGIPLLGTTSDYAIAETDRFLIAIGNPSDRRRIAERLTDRGAQFLTLVHPKAYVAASARLGAGSIVSPFATVGACAVLGSHVVLTFYSSVGHDARVGNCSVLSPYSVANGGSVLEPEVFLGTRATVNPLKRVGAKAKVAAGAVVYEDVPSGALAMGNPARARSMSQWTVPAAEKTSVPSG